MSGFEFQKFVGDMFHRLGYRVEGISYFADSGRDLILEKNAEKMVVECKHHPKSTVSRPVVQKLHSAVLTEGVARKGLVITTGSFSLPAKEYARDERVPVELVDWYGLKKLAEEAGFMLLREGEAPVATSFTVSPLGGAVYKTLHQETQGWISNPLEIGRAMWLSSFAVKLRPLYRMKYSIDRIFTNTVGRPIHNMRDAGEVLADATSGELLATGPTKFILNTNKEISTEAFPESAKAEKPVFILDIAAVKRKVRKELVKRYATVVSYTGRNNVRYTRKAEPKPRDFWLSSVRPVYAPIWKLSFDAAGEQYTTEFFENLTDSTFVLRSDFSRCRICQRSTGERALLCNVCGKVAHSPGFWRRGSHSYFCDLCNKTICRESAYWRRKWLLMKEVVCGQCKDVKQKEGRSFERVPPLRGRG
ncbi:MAG: restriction endonuclease [Candidatus Geothermarchaeales archaeon]